MEKDNGSIIDRAFRKEIGMGINKAVNILNMGGITPEDLGDITNKFKKMITDEIEIRDIPHEYRFLTLNVIMCTMFKTTVEFHKKFVDAINDMSQTEEIEKDNTTR